jgi:hypothetical protein
MRRHHDKPRDNNGIESPGRVLCLVAAPAFAQGDLKIAPVHLSLQIVSDKPGERCARSDASDRAGQRDALWWLIRCESELPIIRNK